MDRYKALECAEPVISSVEQLPKYYIICIEMKIELKKFQDSISQYLLLQNPKIKKSELFLPATLSL
jgi:hypothetical protein